MKWQCPKCGDTTEGWEADLDSTPASGGMLIAVQCQACCEYFWLVPEKLIPYNEG